MKRFKKFFIPILFLLLIVGCSESSFFKINRTKILLIGIDGATWKVIKPLVKEGKLPNISYLMQKGAYGNIELIEPVNSACLWTSIATGKDPEKHGILDWTVYDGKLKTLVPYRSYHRKTKAIWNILSENKKEVGVYNYPVTYPPEKVNGFLVSHLFRPEIRGVPQIYPQNFPSLFYKIPISENINKLQVVSKWDREHYNSYTWLLSDTSRIIWLQKYQPVDLFLAYTQVMDSVQHLFWKYMEPQYFKDKIWDLTEEDVSKYKDVIKDFYRKIDNLIGELTKNIDKKTIVIVVSDHGFRHSEPYEAINLDFNKILKELGLLVFEDNSKIDYVKSKAWSDLPYAGRYHIVINVPDNDYNEFEEVKRKIINIIPNIRFANGKYACKVSYEKTKLDKIRKNKYDLIIQMIDMPEFAKNVFFYINKKRYRVLDFSIRPFINIGLGYVSGAHDHFDGIFIIYDKSGKMIIKGKEITNISVLDITPTILYLMGLPIGKDMDGKVLTAAIESRYLKRNPIISIDSYDKNKLVNFDKGKGEEKINPYDEELFEKLKTLGYIQ